MKQSTVRKVLAVSLLVNVLAVAGVIRSIDARGGWEYLRARWEGAPDRGGVNLDWANYVHRQTLFECLPKRTGRVVFAGDSLTQGCEWGELYPGVLNRGIGGDTSAGLLQRSGSLAELRPRALFLMIGSNDLLNLGLGPEQTLANIRAAVAKIRSQSPETRIYLESNMPTWNVRVNAHSRGVNQGLRAMADSKTIFYIDLYPAFLKGEVLNPAYSADGGHLNGAGYMLWKRLLDPYVEPLLAEPRS